MTETKRRRGLTGWIVGVFIAVAAVAIAASLTVTVTNVVAGGTDQGPAPCDTAVDAAVGPPTYNGTTEAWEVSSIVVSNISASCSGSTLYATFLATDGTQVGTTANITMNADASQTVTLTAADSATVTGAAVAIR